MTNNNKNQNQNQLILKYVALAAKNKKENNSLVPTEDMKNIIKTLNLTHSQIILAAAELTKKE